MALSEALKELEQYIVQAERNHAVCSNRALLLHVVAIRDELSMKSEASNAAAKTTQKASVA